jgi:hypothetical protein
MIMDAVGATVLGDGTTGYLTRNVRYTISMTGPLGGVIVWTNQVPEIRALGGDMLVAVDRLIGKSVQGEIVGGRLVWDFSEPPEFGACGVSPTTNQVTLIPSGRGMAPGAVPGAPDLPPIDGGTSDFPASPPSTPAGGES